MIDSFINTMAFFFVLALVVAFFFTRAFKQMGRDQPEAQARIKRDAMEVAHLLLQRIVRK